MIREIKTAVMLNVNIMNQIWYKNKFAQKDFKGTLMQIWKSPNNFIFTWKQCTKGITL